MIDYTKIFHTVPLKGTIMTRNDKGSKVDEQGKPIIPENKWDSYTTIKNTKSCPLLGAIAHTDFIGIDADTKEIYDYIYSIAKNECKYIAKSIPETKGGHFLFRYDEITSSKLEPLVKYLKKLKVDVQIGKKLIYLATPANTTKELLTPNLSKLDDLTTISNTLIMYLTSLVTPLLLEDVSSSNLTTKLDSNSILVYSSDYYGFLLAGEPTKSLIKRIAPLDYKHIIEMNDIPNGNGTDFLLKVRQKLLADISVSPEVFSKTMHYLVSEFDVDRASKHLKTLDDNIQRDINSPKWRYDSKWKVKGLILTTGYNNTLEVFYSYTDNSWVLFNRTLESYTIYSTFTNMGDSLLALTGKKVPKDTALLKSTKVNIINNPEYLKFINTNDSGIPTFNTFAPTIPLSIVRGDIVGEQIEPTTILKFFENLIPNVDTRNKFLGYIAHKYSTYDYSPLYFVLAGVGGAGKGTLVQHILTAISGVGRVQNVTYELLSSRFNAYMENCEWLEIEEAGEGYSKRDGERLVGILKRITGNPYISIEGKGIDTKVSRHYITPIISTNLSTKLITDTVSNDRRLVLIKCPNKMNNILPLDIGKKTINDTKDLIDQIKLEVPLFASYLRGIYKSKEFKVSDYTDNSNWKSDDYYDYIESTMTNSDKLVNAVSERNSSKFKEVLIEAGVGTMDIENLLSISSDLNSEEHTVYEGFILYHSPSTFNMGIKSLEDIYLSNLKLQGDVRTLFKTIKQRKTMRVDGIIYTLYIVYLSD